MSESESQPDRDAVIARAERWIAEYPDRAGHAVIRALLSLVRAVEQERDSQRELYAVARDQRDNLVSRLSSLEAERDTLKAEREAERTALKRICDALGWTGGFILERKLEELASLKASSVDLTALRGLSAEMRERAEWASDKCPGDFYPQDAFGEAADKIDALLDTTTKGSV